ncbi:hypothetical protein [Azospirillum sp. TSH100]|uniref:hypothetical protein n=1 Tax=Azospirillum sp. TSH100 TaxID=652764 RepID=UPI001304C4A4|nr:hypothetical protein [Azospirillum sp. TSH100]
MTTKLPSDEGPRKEGACVKAAWIRPVLEEVDIVTVTQANSNAVADQDPNQTASG